VALGDATDIDGRKLVEAERIAADGPTSRCRVFANGYLVLRSKLMVLVL
jgi:hypothetical protein